MTTRVDQELRYRRSNGGLRTVMTRCVVQRDPGVRALALTGVGLDLTARQSAAQAPRSATERAALVPQGAGLGAWAMDMAGGEVFWDRQMWVLRGYAPPQHRAMDDAERMACVHPDDRTAIEALFRPAIAEGRRCEYRFRVVWPDARVRWLASHSAERA